MKRSIYRVRGMDCAEEIRALKCAVCPLLGPDGTIDFDLMKGRMVIDALEHTLSDDAIRQAVAKTGMQAVPWSEQAPGNAGADTLWTRHGRALLAASSGGACAAGFLTHTALHGMADALGVGEGIGHAFPAVVIALYVAAVITGGWYIFPKAVFAARRVRPDMNLLMTIAVIGAMLIGEWFEAASVAFLFALALVLESWSVERARRAISSVSRPVPAPVSTISRPSNGIIA